MTNIPTDLLRTFVAVVELRSFTRTAQAQGMTQPAVSAQIRRLQTLLGVELFDKTAPGVALTPIGKEVIECARRMLSVNDDIVAVANPNSRSKLVRIGMPRNFMGEQLAQTLAVTRAHWPNLRFSVKGAGQSRLLQLLNNDQIDLIVAVVAEDPAQTAQYYWPEELVWVRGKGREFDIEAPIPLVSYRERCLCHHAALASLAAAGLSGELVFRANAAEGLRSAVAAGVGVMLLPRSRLPDELEVWDDGPPAVAQMFCGIFLRENEESETLHQLAEGLAAALKPTHPGGARVQSPSEWHARPAASPSI